MENTHIYDKWNSIKKDLNDRQFDNIYFPNNGEVWMCVLDKNVGQEQDGEGEGLLRPVLVLKKINNSIFIIVPLSTKQKDLDYYYNFIDINNSNVSVILAHIRCLSIKRFERKLYPFNRKYFKEIQDIIVNLFFK